MHAASEILALEKIDKRLKTKTIGRSSRSNELWETIDSTNSRAAQLAADGAPEGVIVLARQQTAGRGRLGRVWVSPPDAGIYLSVLLRPSLLSQTELGLITLAIGVAVSSAIERCAGIKLGLKWVNDLVFEGRKVGGILAEMPSISNKETSDKTRPIVVGIGVNLRLTDVELPEELVGKIGSLEQLAGMPIDPNELVADFCMELESIYQTLIEKRTGEIIERWRARSATLNREVIATSGSITIEGVAIDIDDSGALMIKQNNGEVHKLYAGEVTLRSKDGRYA